MVLISFRVLNHLIRLSRPPSAEVKMITRWVISDSAMMSLTRAVLLTVDGCLVVCGGGAPHWHWPPDLVAPPHRDVLRDHSIVHVRTQSFMYVLSVLRTYRYTHAWLCMLSVGGGIPHCRCLGLWNPRKRFINCIITNKISFLNNLCLVLQSVNNVHVNQFYCRT